MTPVVSDDPCTAYYRYCRSILLSM